MGIKAAEEVTDKNTIILVDEADKLFIDDLQGPPKVCQACIGFTATIPTGKEGEVVQDRLDKLNIKIWNNFGYKDEDREPESEVASFDDFFKTARRGAKLIWCTNEMVEAAAALAHKHGLKYEVDCNELARIRDMHGWCLIVTKKNLMRGVDYRLKQTEMFEGEDGIDLLVARPFRNTRAYQQGLARVGRYTEP